MSIKTDINLHSGPSSDKSVQSGSPSHLQDLWIHSLLDLHSKSDLGEQNSSMLGIDEQFIVSSLWSGQSKSPSHRHLTSMHLDESPQLNWSESQTLAVEDKTKQVIYFTRYPSCYHHYYMLYKKNDNIYHQSHYFIKWQKVIYILTGGKLKW